MCIKQLHINLECQNIYTYTCIDFNVDDERNSSHIGQNTVKNINAQLYYVGGGAKKKTDKQINSFNVYDCQ